MRFFVGIALGIFMFTLSSARLLAESSKMEQQLINASKKFACSQGTIGSLNSEEFLALKKVLVKILGESHFKANLWEMTFLGTGPLPSVDGRLFAVDPRSSIQFKLNSRNVGTYYSSATSESPKSSFHVDDDSYLISPPQEVLIQFEKLRQGDVLVIELNGKMIKNDPLKGLQNPKEWLLVPHKERMMENQGR